MSFRGGEKTEGGAALLQKGASPSQLFQMQKGSSLTTISTARGGHFCKSALLLLLFPKRDYFIFTMASPSLLPMTTVA